MDKRIRDKIMKRFLIIILGFLVGYIIADIILYSSLKPIHLNPTPAQLLRFQPVCEGSDPNLVRIAPAELCRHGIECEIDGDCGKQTALGICELLVKIQNGYKVRTIYEKR